MKTFWTAVCLSALMAAGGAGSSLAGGTLKVGVDFEGELKAYMPGPDTTDEVDTSASAAGEVLFAIGPYLDLGIGASGLLPREVDYYRGSFYFISGYGVVRLKFGDQAATPYVTGHLGYGYFDGDSEFKRFLDGFEKADLRGDIYYGVGGGLIINQHLLLEFLYSVNKGTAEVVGSDMDFKYSRMTVSLGYNF